MHTKICIALIMTLLAPAWAFSTTSSSNKIKVSTFNIKWYGLGGGMTGHSIDESRDKDLRAFILKELGSSDVIVFQEIVDAQRLQDKVIKDFMNCYTYKHNNSKHQRVMLCHKKKYKFAKDSQDSNFKIEDVAVSNGKARPAFHGVLMSGKNQPLLYIIGVHLKAFPDRSSVRLVQAEILAKHLYKRKPNIPVVITGDFNTYKTDKSGMSKDDVILINDMFQRYSLKLKHVKNTKFTYRTARSAHNLDHFWISNHLKITAQPKVFSSCNDSQAQAKDYRNILIYNSNISDHCPMTVEFELP